MCGIFAILNNMTARIEKNFIKSEFEKGKNRGPDDSNIIDLYIMNCMLGFHRLAINGLNKESNQPFYIDNIFLVCNGEIYNYKELYNLIDINPTTNSDCEVIVHLYKRYGMEQTIRMLDGEFSFILLDTSNDCKKMFVGRDPYGVRPLYYLHIPETSVFGFASEIKQLSSFQSQNSIIRHFQPGTLMLLDITTIEYNSSEMWKYKYTTKYHENLFSFESLYSPNPNYHLDDVYYNIRTLLFSAVHKRCKCSERPIACLLSGGLDSSLIAAIVNHYLLLDNKQLHTYSIGFENSEDLRNARIVSNYLKTEHHELIITEKEYLDAIPHVIQTIESYDTTTVRASVGNYLIAKHISETSDAKVIFNGDGSDELTGGYLYMHNCPDSTEFDKETRRLLRNIHYFDVLRSDKSISSNGLEARTPFLDLVFVQYYLSIHPSLRFHPGNNQCEKFLLRKSFESYDLLPSEILWRTKEAFSDGVTIHSITDIINKHVEGLVDKDSLSSATKEEQYYSQIYDSFYPNTDIIPYYWKPRYVTNSGYIDPSARLLDVYKSR